MNEFWQSLGTFFLTDGLDIIVSIISIAVSVWLVILQINKNANEQLKTTLAQNRPLIIASMYAHMDIKGTNKCRTNFTRYIAKTPKYKILSANSDDQDHHTFFRIRNESNNHAHGVKIKLSAKNNQSCKCFKEEYKVNIVASFCEYLFIVPSEYMHGDFFDEYYVEVHYSSISGEEIKYICEYDRKNGEFVSNHYEGRYRRIKKKKVMNTFNLHTQSDSLETIEINEQSRG